MYLDSIRPIIVNGVTTTVTTFIPSTTTTFMPSTTTEIPLTLVSQPPFITTAIVATESIPSEVVHASYRVYGSDGSDIFPMVMGVITLIVMIGWVVYKIVKHRYRFISAAKSFRGASKVVIIETPSPTSPTVEDQSTSSVIPLSVTETVDVNLISVSTPDTERRYLPAPYRG